MSDNMYKSELYYITLTILLTILILGGFYLLFLAIQWMVG